MQEGRFVVGRLVNANWQVALCVAMGAVCVQLTVYCC